jgi:hypothetical protein
MKFVEEQCLSAAYAKFVEGSEFGTASSAQNGEFDRIVKERRFSAASSFKYE